MTSTTSNPQPDYLQLSEFIKARSAELGFQQVGICDTDLAEDETRMLNWLDAGHHGEMDYMAKHGTRRSRPGDLHPGTLRIISVRMDYQPAPARDAQSVLDDAELGFVSRYALGRDYHKVLRKRLQKLADSIVEQIGPFGYRAFVDSAPVLEKGIARKAGLGWVGKHSNILNREAGSWFFLGELYVDLPLPVSEPIDDHCGKCSACIDVCPTAAIVEPYKVDARRCISYHTIELHGPIPVEFRRAMGNRIYGCDDCQMVCPWNRFAVPTPEVDFIPRHGLDSSSLIDLFAWSEETFLKNTEGSPIRRIGYNRWLRNIAVALGNASTSPQTINALKTRLGTSDELVKEHILWALEQHALQS